MYQPSQNNPFPLRNDVTNNHPAPVEIICSLDSAPLQRHDNPSSKSGLQSLPSPWRQSARAVYWVLVNLHPQAVRLVLAQGFPVAVDVVGGSMTPTIEQGTRVTVEPVAEDLHPGDIVLILSSNQAEFVLHRVIRLFAEGGQHFVIHQGDAQTAAFAACLREAVLGRAVGFPLTPARALPTLEVLDPEALTRFQQR